MKYEYRIIDIPSDQSASDAEAAFNQLSAEGWRMVRYVDALFQTGWAARVIFEREAKSVDLLTAAMPKLPGPLPYVPNAIQTQPKRLHWQLATCRGISVSVGDVWRVAGFDSGLRFRVVDIVGNWEHTEVITETITDESEADDPKNRPLKCQRLIETFILRFQKVEE